ncbi:MAG TPA: acyl-CoA dehydrogenase family protein [Planctomycetota bacterium]|nr:acyl-CoA dehydrogenase family protein [Planctomycetota bacterium]
MTDTTTLAQDARQKSQPFDESILSALLRGRLPQGQVSAWPELPGEEAELFDVLAGTLERFLHDDFDAVAIDREAKIPDDVLAAFKELGLFGLIVPEEHGGLGLSQTSYTRVLARVGADCASTAVTLGAHSSIGMKALLLFGNEAQKARWLPQLASGERIAAFCLTEPGSGSDAASIRTKAVRREDGKIQLDGEKVWITNGGIASFFTVFARSEPPAGWPEGKPHLTCFVVEGEQPGVRIGNEEDKLGLKGSSTTTVALEGVIVDEAARIGVDGDGFRIALEVLNSGRLGLAGACAASARRLLELATKQATTREQFGRKIASFGLIRDKLARIATEVFGMESMAYLVAGIVDRKARGEALPTQALEAAACKVWCTERLWETAHEALQIAGGNGYMREFPYERVLRDARVNMIFEGTNEILRLMLALGALKGLGAHLKDTAKKLKSAGSFVPSLVELGRFKMGSVPRIECPLAAEHCSAQALQDWPQVERVLRAASRGARRILATHGKKVVEAQEDSAALADLAMGGLNALATFVRVHGRGRAPTEVELTLLHDLVARRIEDADRLLAALERGVPASRRSVAQHLIEGEARLPSPFDKG